MSSAAAQDEAEDRYHTQIEAGDVRLFTLDQLDAAFNAGLIHENTYVCLEGASEWLTLGEVAGLGDEAPAAAAVPYQGALAASPSIMPSAAYNSVAPMVMPRSFAPVSADIDDDAALLAMRPKRRAGKVLAGLAVMGLAGLGFAVVHSGGLRLPELKLADGVAQASAASLTLSSLKDAAPTPPAPTPVAEATRPEPPKVEEANPADAAKPSDTTPPSVSADKVEKKSDERFAEDVKAALLNKDKQHATDQKHKKATRKATAVRRGASGKAGKSSSGFKSGGSAYDPLNAKL